MIQYKKLKLHDHAGDISKRWYVQYYYKDINTQKWVKIRTWVSSKTTTKRTRNDEGKELLKKISTKLTMGFNPLCGRKNLTIRAEFENIISMKKFVVCRRTITAYECSVKHFCNWLDKNKLSAMEPQMLTRLIVKTYLEEYFILEKVCIRSRNNRLNCLKSLFSEIVEDNLLEHNVFKSIKNLPVPEPEIMAYTQEELIFLKDKLQYTQPILWLCALFVHYAFIRPAELVRLKISCLNFSQKTISLQGNKTKNKRSQVILMSDSLYNKLIEMGYDRLPQDLFIISNGRNLTPGTKEIAPTRISEVWKKNVIDKYKINKGIYLMKHTGAGILIDSGANPRNVQLQLRHSSLEETMGYLQKYSQSPNENLRQYFKEIEPPTSIKSIKGNGKIIKEDYDFSQN